MHTRKISKRTWAAVAITGILAFSGCTTTPPAGEAAEKAAEAQRAEIAQQEQELATLQDQVADKEKELDYMKSRPVPVAPLAEAGPAGQRAAAADPPPPAPLAAPGPPEPPPAPRVRRITLDEGTPIVIRTTREISTKAVKPGDPFEASLEQPLMDGNMVLAPKGARVIGKVTESDQGGRVQGRAQLAVRVDRVEMANGQMVDFSTNELGMSADKSYKDDALKVGIAAGIGTVIGAVTGGKKGAAVGAGVGAGAGTGAVLMTRGDAAILPAESVLSFRLASPVTITQPL